MQIREGQIERDVGEGREIPWFLYSKAVHKHSQHDYTKNTYIVNNV